MPNTFSAPAVPGSDAIIADLIDPREIRKNRTRFRREEVPELAYANSLYVPAGLWPARGWLLVSRSDYNELAANNGLYQTYYQLNIDEFDAAAPGLTFNDLVIVQARCVTTGLISDANAVYLLEITDQRGLLWNRWFNSVTVNQYNVLSPAYPDQYYFTSTAAGPPWDWNGMIGQVWNQIGVLGAYPGLPTTPVGTPQNWSLPGTSNWRALNRMLDHIGCRVSVDLKSPTQYGIVHMGDTDSVFTNLVSKYAGRVQDDMDWIDVGSGRVPGTVTVLFHRKNQVYGTEETIRNDNLQWQMNAIYQVGVAAPAIFSAAQGEHFIWSDYQVRYDIDNNPLAADVTIAGLIAADVVNQFYARIYWQTLGYLNRTYAGIIPFTAGSQVDGVCWRQDFMAPMERQGWITQIVRGEQPPWPVLK